jgi:hypothetical protein
MHRDDEHSLAVFSLDKLVSHDYHLPVSAIIPMPTTRFGIGSALD